MMMNKKLEKSLQNILDFRKLDQNKQQQMGMAFYAKEKVRTTFSNYSKVTKNKSDDFRKEFKNLLYPLFDSRSKKTKKKSNYALEYDTKENKVTVKDQDLFQILVNYINNVDVFLQKQHSKGLYKNLSDVIYPITLIQQIEDKSGNNKAYLKKLKQIKEKVRKNGKYSAQEWNDYIMKIDPQVLIYCFSAVLVMNNYEKIKNCVTCFPDFFGSYITKEFSDVVAIEKEQLIKIVENNVYNILARDPLSPIKESDLKNQGIDKDNFKSYVNSVKLKDLSAIKLELQNQSYDTTYYRDKNGKRKRKRNQKLMDAVQEDRIKNNLIMGKKRAHFPAGQCDVCDNKFASKGEPQCHHMVPIEYNGSDTEYNYAFLCGTCHDVFTHDDLSPEAKHHTDKLKEKGLVTLNYYKEMINDGHLGLPQIRYLHESGYIHLVELLHLNKHLHEINQDWDDWKDDRKLLQNLDKIIPNTRWTRAQKKVFTERKENNLIMEIKRDDYKINNCDGCDTSFSSSPYECHHIIAKNEKFRKKALKGPESPYNYAFLCKNCHNKFRPFMKNPHRKKIVKSLKEKELVTKETVKKMILHDGLNKLQLDYLKDESYIDKVEYKELLDHTKRMKDYLN